MNEGVGRARIEGERWRGEPTCMMSLHHNETLSSLAIIIYFVAHYLNGCVPYSVCGKWSCSGKATHRELPVMSVFIGSLMDKRGSKKIHCSVINTLFQPQKRVKLLLFNQIFPDIFSLIKDHQLWWWWCRKYIFCFPLRKYWEWERPSPRFFDSFPLFFFISLNVTVGDLKFPSLRPMVHVDILDRESYIYFFPMHWSR